jgi:hypothetical protein
MTLRLHFFAAELNSVQSVIAHNDIGAFCADVRRDGR